jgi:hypothetical protein
VKITTDTPDELRIDYVPWLVGLGLIAFTLVFVAGGIASILGGNVQQGLFAILLGGGIGLGAIFAFTERTQFWADRRSGTVVMRRRTLLKQTEQRIDLDKVTGATVQISHSTGGNQTTRPAITLRDGQELPLRNTFTGGGAARHVAQRIEAWLAAKG